MFECEREGSVEKRIVKKFFELGVGEMKKGFELECFIIVIYKIMKVVLLYRFGVLKFYLLKEIVVCI